jgi:hypothetical protein
MNVDKNQERIMRGCCLAGLACLLFAGALAAADKESGETEMLTLHMRQRKRVENSRPAKFEVVEKTVAWQPKETAIIVCDMWDAHWCRGAAARVVELAGPLNRLVNEARRRGVFVIHAPSTTVDF